MGRKDSPTREAFIDATERLLYREGSAKVNARSVANEAGLKKQSLFYYFSSMDELISETHSRHIKAYENGLAEVFAAENPLRALWELQLNGNGRLFTEFLAMANHSETLRSVIIDASARTNKLILDAFTNFFAHKEIDPRRFPTSSVLFALSAVSSHYMIYKELGILDREEELLTFIEGLVAQIDP